MNKEQFDKASLILEKVNNLKIFQKTLTNKYSEIKEDLELQNIFTIASEVTTDLLRKYEREFEAL